MYYLKINTDTGNLVLRNGFDGRFSNRLGKATIISNYCTYEKFDNLCSTDSCRRRNVRLNRATEKI